MHKLKFKIIANAKSLFKIIFCHKTVIPLSIFKIFAGPIGQIDI